MYLKCSEWLLCGCFGVLGSFQGVAVMSCVCRALLCGCYGVPLLFVRGFEWLSECCYVLARVFQAVARGLP